MLNFSALLCGPIISIVLILNPYMHIYASVLNIADKIQVFLQSCCSLLAVQLLQYCMEVRLPGDHF